MLCLLYLLWVVHAKDYSVAHINAGGINLSPWEFRASSDAGTLKDFVDRAIGDLWDGKPAKTIGDYIPSILDGKADKTINAALSDGYKPGDQLSGTLLDNILNAIKTTTLKNLKEQAYTIPGGSAISISEKDVKLFGHMDRLKHWSITKSDECRKFLKAEVGNGAMDYPTWVTKWVELYKERKDEDLKKEEGKSVVVNIGKDYLPKDSIFTNILKKVDFYPKEKEGVAVVMEMLYDRIMYVIVFDWATTGGGDITKLTEAFDAFDKADSDAVENKLKQLGEIINKNDITLIQEFPIPTAPKTKEEYMNILKPLIIDYTVHSGESYMTLIVTKNDGDLGELDADNIIPIMGYDKATKTKSEKQTDEALVIKFPKSKLILGSFHASLGGAEGRCNNWVQQIYAVMEDGFRFIVGADCNENVFTGTEMKKKSDGLRAAAEKKGKTVPEEWNNKITDKEAEFDLSSLSINPLSGDLLTVHKTRSFNQYQLRKAMFEDFTQKDYIFVSTGLTGSNPTVGIIGMSTIDITVNPKDITSLPNYPDIPNSGYLFDHYILTSVVAVPDVEATAHIGYDDYYNAHYDKEQWKYMNRLRRHRNKHRNRKRHGKNRLNDDYYN